MRSLGGVIDYVSAIRSESARFHDLIRGTAMDTPVPSCPEWTVADLAWHLTGVQYRWGSIVHGLLQDPESIQRLDRPTDGQLPGMFEQQSARLIEALERRHADDECWSWHDAGHSVGWVRRRQAHEALIHRVDAELAAGTSSDIDPVLAADGVDEILRFMLDLDNVPDWATYEPDGSTAVIEIDGGAASWAMNLGRFKGTSPNSGRTIDVPALRLIAETDQPNVVLRGSGTDIDLWLWGRGPLDPIKIDGDPEVAQQIRATAADGTQ